jgi:leucine dehydrogenase
MTSPQLSDVPVPGFERVVRAVDPGSGLHALIAVHDTTLGPACGGLRMLPYKDEEEAKFDVLRLAKGMTYKSAVAHTGLGGGKAVLIGDPRKKSEALYLALGRAIDALGGRYYTAEDMNTSVADLEVIRRATKYVVGLERQHGGSGNPSPYTAYGVFLGVRAALGWATGNDDPRGRTVALQGVGAVGSALAKRLIGAGAKVVAADIDKARLAAVAREVGVQPIGDDEIFGLQADVFAPCARGAVLNDQTIPQLRCKVVAGAANNLLLEPRHGQALVDRGILYAPDYVINAGGVINISVEFMPGGYDEAEAMRRIERIPQALKELWQISRDQKIPTSEAADRLAERIVAEGRKRAAGKTDARAARAK